MKSLRARGRRGVQLVISDHHLGLKSAIASVFVGAAWQRCRVHYAEDRIMPTWLQKSLREKDFALLNSA